MNNLWQSFLHNVIFIVTTLYWFVLIPGSSPQIIFVQLTWSCIAFKPEASFGIQVFLLPASVCLFMRLCVNPELVNAVACDPFKPGGCFTNVSRALQNILSKFVCCRNRTSYEHFKLKLCSCAQSHALGTRTKFQLEILTINVITGIVYFREIILESSQNVNETTPWISKFRPEVQTTCLRILLFWGEWLNLTFKVKFNLQVKIL